MPPPDGLHADFVRHARAKTDPGLWSLAVRRFGNWAAGLPQAPLRWAGLKVYGGALVVVQATTGNLLNREVTLGRDPDLRDARNVIVHADVVIGDRCRIHSGVSLGTNERFKLGVPRIGNDVVIETGAKILGPVTIGDRAVVRANSLVLTDVPADAVVMGVPARVVRDPVVAAVGRGAVAR